VSVKNNDNTYTLRSLPITRLQEKVVNETQLRHF